MALLAEAAADGRITLEEHSHRVQRAYTARTLGDLAGLTDDLALPGAQPLRLDNSRAVTAFFTTERRSGRWVVPERLVVTAIGGQVVLDLREALLQGQRTVMYVSAMGGQVNLLLPAGVTVVTRSLSDSLPGARPDPRPEPLVPHGTPVIELHTLTLLGRIHVRTPRPRRGGLFSRRPR